jgi:prepilin-type N-terminal cleavage/methylation domain-containing protein
MKRAPSSRGFSLVELMVVVMIIMVISVVAIPNIMNSINNVRLRSMVGTVSGVIQNGRMLCIKANRQYTVRFSMAGASSVAFVDVNGDGTPQSIEPQAQLGGTIIQVAAPVGTTPLDNTVLGFTPQAGNLTFNARGLPCTSAGVCGVGFVMYFTDQRRVGGTGYAAVSVTPAGRVKTWMWAGASWSD